MWKSDFWTYTTRHVGRAGQMNATPIRANSWPRGPDTLRLTQVRRSILCQQRQVAKFVRRLFYFWSLLRNNNTAINLQMFTSSYGSSRSGAWDQARAHTEGFFHPDLFFSRPVCLGYYEKSRDICVFGSDKLINNFNVSSNIKIALHYSVYMRTSGEKVRISDEAKRVQSVSYSHIRSLSLLYTAVCLREGKRGTCLGPHFATVMCKVAYLAFKGAQQQLECISGLLCFLVVMCKYLAFKRDQRNCNALFFQRATKFTYF